MIFNIPPDWCVINARKESEIEEDFTIGNGSGIKRQACPVCRGYELERSWCDHCNKSGIVKIEN